MDVRTPLIAVIGSLLSINCFAQWMYKDSKVEKIGSSWDQGYACVHFENGEVIKLELSTDKGKAELEMLIMAKTLESVVTVALNTEEEPSTGCNTGTTVKLHGTVVVN